MLVKIMVNFKFLQTDCIQLLSNQPSTIIDQKTLDVLNKIAFSSSLL